MANTKKEPKPLPGYYTEVKDLKQPCKEKEVILTSPEGFYRVINGVLYRINFDSEEYKKRSAEKMAAKLARKKERDEKIRTRIAGRFEKKLALSAKREARKMQRLAKLQARKSELEQKEKKLLSK